ncbi:MAG: helix-turn-helix domain-containing protein [Clostridia bacterium]|nr:helix-turn-helix domain-containing protein [Clostridia bacterium]
MEDIAGIIGFKTPTGFATSFKKLTGISPTEYRKHIKYNRINNPSQIHDLAI